MHKKNKIKKVIVSAVFLIGIVFVFGPGNALAKTVTDGNFKITYNDPLFAVTNAAPGQAYVSDMLIENLGGKDRKFQFELDMTANPKDLADRLFLKIENTDGGSNVCEFGCAGDKSIGSLGKTEFVIKMVPGNSSKNFRFILTLDPTVGNEFQNTSAGFDMKMGFKDEVTATAVGGGGVAGGPGAAVGGVGPTGVIGGTVAGVAGGIVGGVESETVGEQPGQVQGEEMVPGKVEGASIETCKGWPKWVWILALIIYFAAFLWRTFEKFEKQVKKREIRWVWQAIFAGAAFLAWYFFDKCREYRWFILIVVIGGAAIYLYYLFLFKKRLKVQPIKEIQEQPPLENKDL
jgi:hypothetical protein